MSIRTFFHSHAEDPHLLGLLLILIGSIASFGFVLWNGTIFLSGFDADNFNPDVYLITSQFAGLILGMLALKYRSSIKRFKGDTKYRNYVIIIGLVMLIFSFYLPGIFIITGGLISSYKK